ncbi:MAG: redox-sensing transcriptional repressor Rex, partial [Actinomycetota bacterium]|nr:redox-sensing transcriptional repressor Rex [Actinomycetota bacterium]
RGPIPEATVSRLPLYLRSLVGIAASGTATVSSAELGRAAGVNAAKVRKDLSYLGSYGTRGVGYDVEFLIFEMSRELGLTRDRAVIIAGAGNLGHALANYQGFEDRGFPVTAFVETDPDKVGTSISGVPVRGIDELSELVADRPGCIGVVATPAGVAQQAVDNFVAVGIGSILNFAPSVVTVPGRVNVRQVDLALELQILSFYAQRTDAEFLEGLDARG